MTTPHTVALANRRKLGPAAGRNSQPDPRPLTEYEAVYSEPGGTHSRLTITLAQPCIIRHPVWEVLSCADGGHAKPQTVTVVDNTTIIFDFEDILDTMFAFVLVPYQDMEIQNFQGGFVRPGGQWFRKAS